MRAPGMAISLPISGNAALSRIAGSQRAPSKDFTSWLKSHGEDMDSIAVSIGMSEHGRTLYASRPICAGECMIRFTQNLVLAPEKLPKEAINLLKDANDYTRMSLLLLAEQHKGQKSKWTPYMDYLPSFKELHSTIFWDSEELACLQCSPLYHWTCETNDIIHLQYNEVKHVVESCPHIYGGSLSLEQFKHAYGIVSSRCWGEGPHSSMAMIPLVDFANHDPKTCTHFAEDGEYSVLVADRDYQTGEEVRISYGKHSNAALALNYGFVIPDNPYDMAEIWLEIPPDDPLREKKLEYLLKNKMSTLQNPDGSQSGGRPFILMEVYRSSGKECIFPSAARAFSRVICAHSLEELENIEKEAEAYSVAPFAFRPREDINKEAKAMYFLLHAIQDHIEEHLAAIEDSQRILRQEHRQIADGVFTRRVKTATKLDSLVKRAL